jgi:hypothetical protein
MTGRVTSSTCLTTTVSRLFYLHKQTQILGGFFSTTADAYNERDPQNHLSICSGDLTGDDLDAFFDAGIYATFDENSAHVFTTASGINETGILDGVVVRGGFANFFGDRGGGVIIGGLGGGTPGDPVAPPTISNCLFTRCYAEEMGGAMYNTMGDPFQLWDCKFVKNRSGTVGGYNKAGAILSDSPQTWLVRCSFDQNFTTGSGGAVSHDAPAYPAYKLISCAFTHNVAEEAGGAVFFKTIAGSGAADAGTEISDCLFVGNEAAEGGAIFGGTLSSTFGSQPLLISSSTFVDNVSAGIYGGVYFNLPTSSAQVQVRNSIFWNNAGSGSGIESQVAVDPNPSQLTVQYSDVEGW